MRTALDVEDEVNCSWMCRDSRSKAVPGARGDFCTMGKSGQGHGRACRSIAGKGNRDLSGG